MNFCRMNQTFFCRDKISVVLIDWLLSQPKNWFLKSVDIIILSVIKVFNCILKEHYIYFKLNILLIEKGWTRSSFKKKKVIYI